MKFGDFLIVEKAFDLNGTTYKSLAHAIVHLAKHGVDKKRIKELTKGSDTMINWYVKHPEDLKDPVFPKSLPVGVNGTSPVVPPKPVVAPPAPVVEPPKPVAPVVVPPTPIIPAEPVAPVVAPPVIPEPEPEPEPVVPEEPKFDTKGKTLNDANLYLRNECKFHPTMDSDDRVVYVRRDKDVETFTTIRPKQEWIYRKTFGSKVEVKNLFSPEEYINFIFTHIKPLAPAAAPVSQPVAPQAGTPSGTVAPFSSFIGDDTRTYELNKKIDSRASWSSKVWAYNETTSAMELMKPNPYQAFMLKTSEINSVSTNNVWKTNGTARNPWIVAAAMNTDPCNFDRRSGKYQYASNDFTPDTKVSVKNEGTPVETNRVHRHEFGHRMDHVLGSTLKTYQRANIYGYGPNRQARVETSIRRTNEHWSENGVGPSLVEKKNNSTMKNRESMRVLEDILTKEGTLAEKLDTYVKEKLPQFSLGELQSYFDRSFAPVNSMLRLNAPPTPTTPVPEDILGCTDSGKRDQWIARAIVCLGERDTIGLGTAGRVNRRSSMSNIQDMADYMLDGKLRDKMGGFGHGRAYWRRTDGNYGAHEFFAHYVSSQCDENETDVKLFRQMFQEECAACDAKMKEYGASNLTVK